MHVDRSTTHYRQSLARNGWGVVEPVASTERENLEWLEAVA